MTERKDLRYTTNPAADNKTGKNGKKEAVAALSGRLKK